LKLYKLTNQNNQTKNQTQWGEGVTHYGTGIGPLCSEGWIYAYESPELAVLMNPIHANFNNPKLWIAEGEIRISDGTKCGCKSLTTLNEITLPSVNSIQRVAFGILCSLKVYQENSFVTWTKNWLSNKDRSKKSAAATANAVTYTASYDSTIYAAIYAANAAVDSAIYAANAAATTANSAIYAAAYAADSAIYAAQAAAHAVDSVDKSAIKINFVEIANEAMQYD
jgi:hypothetical protein